VVARVDEGSPAARAGVEDGDVIVSADGEQLRDIIDWQWLADGYTVEVAVRHGDTMRLEDLVRQPGESWGIEFADAVFDGIKTCRNSCDFCFMTQLPAGLRRALYLRDDDYRLSFLQGNFVTLTNLTDQDVERIDTQHLSPLYVSLHAVQPAVRAALIGAREDRTLERFDALLDAGIDFHVQIVLVPGVNDGETLDQTLEWLGAREGVLSVGIVPLGYTAHQRRFAASFGPDGSEAVVRQIEPWQRAFRKRDGVGWVYLADEFYLNACLDLPDAESYDGYPQYENGIGIVRAFVDEMTELADDLRRALAALPPGCCVALVSGTLAAPVVRQTLLPLSAETGGQLEVLAVENRFFGGNVSVTGLLTGTDLVPAIAGCGADVILVPSIVVNADGLLLDDIAASDLGTRSGRDVRLVSCDAGGLLSALEELAASPPHNR
jgi:putative radical SAM enzyme (TIGR03279 family)